MIFESIEDSWPRDLKLFALMSAVWASGLTARIISSKMGHYSFELEAVIGGMKFFGNAGAFVLLTQSAIFASFAIGIATEKRWGLILALIYLTQVVLSHLVFMIAYLDDFSQGLNVRIASGGGIVTVLILLYLWIRSRDLLFTRPA